MEHLSGHVAGSVGRQEGNRAADVVDGAQALERQRLP
jgi:hypothetical protein